jgi:DNA-binding CsgD family transcriptional regulator
VDDGVATTIDRLLPEQLRSLQRLSGLPVVFGGSARGAPLDRRLTINRLVGARGRLLAGLQVASGRGLGGAALRHGSVQRVNDYAGTDAITHDYDHVVREERLTSVLAVPVLVRGTVQAVLYGATRDRPIGDRAMRTAAAVASQFRRQLEDGPSAGEERRRPSSVALDELADIIRSTGDEVLRARLGRVHRDLAAQCAMDGGARPSTAGRLTARELDALRLVAVGASNLEIAAELWLSPETVKAYLRSAMRKLSVGNRTAAVHAARLRGLI